MQRISVTVRLNRSTLQFEDTAYQRLEGYLGEAARTLEGNPDQAEILADLEQAVADQCARRMRPDQGVATLAELQPALDEIGSVQVPGAAGATEPPSRNGARPLQQVSEGALISGVCQGFARYFQLDVTLLRAIALVLLFVSGGGMILVYVVLMLLLPYAPRQPGGPRVRWLPAKLRDLVESLRTRLSAAAS
jgi:phage shock protein PspC (stress-responsive transcriptional regulator)